MIILSALGTGPYREAIYQSENHSRTVTTGLFAVALKTWYPDAQVKLLATKGAWESKNGDFVREHHPDFEPIHIPDGRTEAEAWELFQKIAASVPANSKIIFDITHSLRSLPMLGFLALSYLRVVKNIEIERVYYGALELTPPPKSKPAKCETCKRPLPDSTGPTQITPVVDLTPLVKLLDWAQAANRFSDTGDARLFKPLLDNESDSKISKIASSLEKLSKSLFYNRVRDVGEVAKSLQVTIENIKHNDFSGQHAPFNSVLDEIVDSISPLIPADFTIVSDAIQSQYNLILWYRENGHYTQSLGLARELLVSIKIFGDIKVYGEVCDIKSHVNRRSAEKWLSEAAKPGAPKKSRPVDEHTKELVEVWVEVNRLRNDFMHFGMSDKASVSIEDTESEIVKALLRIAGSASPLGLQLEKNRSVQS